jgi:hypothetical protein
VSNKTATTCTPDLARKTQDGGSHNTFSVDVFVGAASNTGQTAEATDDVHNCNDEKPKITLTPPGGSECEVGDDCEFVVTITSGTHVLSGGTYSAAPASTVSLVINGQTVETTPIPTGSSTLWSYSFSYVPTAEGTATVQATVVDSVLYSATDSAVIDITD